MATFWITNTPLLHSEIPKEQTGTSGWPLDLFTHEGKWVSLYNENPSDQATWRWYVHFSVFLILVQRLFRLEINRSRSSFFRCLAKSCVRLVTSLTRFNYSILHRHTPWWTQKKGRRTWKMRRRGHWHLGQHLDKRCAVGWTAMHAMSYWLLRTLGLRLAQKLGLCRCLSRPRLKCRQGETQIIFMR